MTRPDDLDRLPPASDIYAVGAAVMLEALEAEGAGR